MRRRLRGEAGFTMIELMIVVNIMGILTLTAIPAFQTMKYRAEDGANKANVRLALEAIDSYYQDHTSYSGMTLVQLEAYDESLDPSKYTLAGVSDLTYCVQSPQGAGAHVWRKNGPGALFERAPC